MSGDVSGSLALLRRISQDRSRLQEQQGINQKNLPQEKPGAILKIVTQPLAATASTYISESTAQKDALAAVGGGSVLFTILEKSDVPPVSSVDALTTRGGEYEVKVNACTGAVLAIIIGG